MHGFLANRKVPLSGAKQHPTSLLTVVDFGVWFRDGNCGFLLGHVPWKANQEKFTTNPRSVFQGNVFGPKSSKGKFCPNLAKSLGDKGENAHKPRFLEKKTRTDIKTNSRRAGQDHKDETWSTDLLQKSGTEKGVIT